MWRRAVDQTGTAALYFGLVLSQVVGEGGVVKVLCRPGQQVSVPCSYHYEDDTHVSQLSVQWRRSPNDRLLCYYIKHKAFENCTSGYGITYSPGNITLTIHRVTMEDFEAHVCFVSIREEFVDYSFELVRLSDSVTSAPNGGRNQSGSVWTLALLQTLGLFVCLFA